MSRPSCFLPDRYSGKAPSQGHDEADRGIGFGLDRDDPPIGPQIGEIGAKPNGIALRQSFALNSEEDRLIVVGAKQVAAFCVSRRQDDVPAPTGQLPCSVVRGSVARDL